MIYSSCTIYKMYKQAVLSVALCVFMLGLSCQAFNIIDIVNGLSDKDKFEFVKYHIQKGYELVSEGKKSVPQDLDTQEFLPKSDDIPEAFSILVYAYARTKASITDEVILKQLREVICFPDGSCIDIGDIGVHP